MKRFPQGYRGGYGTTASLTLARHNPLLGDAGVVVTTAKKQAAMLALHGRLVKA